MSIYGGGHRAELGGVECHFAAEKVNVGRNGTLNLQGRELC